ncbi:unnamed protein product, partial [Rotaria sordida]
QKELICDQEQHSWLFQSPLIDYHPSTTNQTSSFYHVSYYLIWSTIS